jgi:hypothetical protein
MINIEQNTHLFSSEVNQASTCECIKQNAIITHKNKQDHNDLMKPQLCNDKFHVYELPNPVYPEHPMTVELASTVGNIVIYLKADLIGKDLESKIESRLMKECNLAIYDISMLEENSAGDELITNGVSYVDIQEPSSRYVPSRHTLVSKSIDLTAERVIQYHNPASPATIFNPLKFVWNVYIIYESAFSINGYLRFDCDKQRTFSRFVNIYNCIYTKSSLYGRDRELLKVQMSRIRGIHHVCNSFIRNDTEYQPSGLYDNKPSFMYAPNTIILDGADLFADKKFAIKQLEYPMLEHYNFPKFINLHIPINDFDVSVNNIYQRENSHICRSVLDIRSISVCYTGINNMLCDVSWAPNNIKETATKKPTKKPTEVSAEVSVEEITTKSTSDPRPLVYYLQYQYIVDEETAMSDNLLLNKNFLANYCKKYKKKIIAGDISTINVPDDKCYVTGVPLWGYYYEIQLLNVVKLSSELAFKVIICMNISKVGLQSLVSSMLNLQISPKYFPTLTLPNMLSYIFNVQNEYSAEAFNLVMRQSTLNCIDIINKIKNNKHKHLLASIDKFGCCAYGVNTYVVNPDTNDIFIGVIKEDLNDTLLLHMNNKSDAYIYII